MHACKRVLVLLVAASLPLVMLACTQQAPPTTPVLEPKQSEAGGNQQAPPANAARKLVLVVHGGEGDLPEKMTKELEKQHREVLEEALQKGYAKLKKGTSIDAVEAAIRVLEDSPLFNAGKGAVFTHEGTNELDASIMEGKDKKAGAVAGVTIVKNPITAARAVMESNKHVLLVGRGAELFAIKQKLEVVHPEYFWTEQRWNELQEALRKEAKERKEGAAPARRRHMGTVGAVALDRDGNLAAGTSTGGMTNKWSGRVGDSPIIGAGTYADNEACAVSCTGWGEYFIRFAVAHDITARVKYDRKSVKEAAEEVVNNQLQQAGAEGGAIVLDRRGDFHITYNKLAGQMSRGYITSDKEKPQAAILDRPLPGAK
jgi:beta-aspartyl-peptidase (threonine type)